MWTKPNRTSNKRDLEDEEPQEDISENQPKKARFNKEVSYGPTEEEPLFKRNSPGPEGLYDPDKDLWVQFHTDGLAILKKRLLFIREIDNNDLKYRRNKCYHKLR